MDTDAITRCFVDDEDVAIEQRDEMNEATDVQLELSQRQLLIDLPLDWTSGWNIVGHLVTFGSEFALLHNQQHRIRINLNPLP